MAELHSSAHQAETLQHMAAKRGGENQAVHFCLLQLHTLRAWLSEPAQVTQPRLSQLPGVTQPRKSHQTLGNFTLKFSASDCTLRLPERKRKLALKFLPKPHQANTPPAAEIINKSDCPV